MEVNLLRFLGRAEEVGEALLARSNEEPHPIFDADFFEQSLDLAGDGCEKQELRTVAGLEGPFELIDVENDLIDSPAA